MNKRYRTAAAILAAGLSLSATQPFAQAPTADMREAAGTIASVQGPLEKRDLKNYCTVIHGSAEYAGYVSRACQHAVKVRVKQPADCTETNVRKEIDADLGRCLAMSAAEFEQTALKWREMLDVFLKDMQSKGVDGEKLIAEERGKLR